MHASFDKAISPSHKSRTSLAPDAPNPFNRLSETRTRFGRRYHLGIKMCNCEPGRLSGANQRLNDRQASPEAAFLVFYVERKGERHKRQEAPTTQEVVAQAGSSAARLWSL